MWYELLPTVVIISTLVMIPKAFTYASNLLYLGQPFKRLVYTDFETYKMLRDARVSKTDFAYEFTGIDNIPDEEAQPTAMSTKTEHHKKCE